MMIAEKDDTGIRKTVYMIYNIDNCYSGFGPGNFTGPEIIQVMI